MKQFAHTFFHFCFNKSKGKNKKLDTIGFKLYSAKYEHFMSHIEAVENWKRNKQKGRERKKEFETEVKAFDLLSLFRFSL